MTEKEALKAIEHLKKNKKFRQGHYQAGYTEYFFEKKHNSFIEKIEDFSCDIFNPTIREKKYTENDFTALLMADFEYNDFVKYLF